MTEIQRCRESTVASLFVTTRDDGTLLIIAGEKSSVQKSFDNFERKDYLKKYDKVILVPIVPGEKRKYNTAHDHDEVFEFKGEE